MFVCVCARMRACVVCICTHAFIIHFLPQEPRMACALRIAHGTCFILQFASNVKLGGLIDSYIEIPSVVV